MLEAVRNSGELAIASLSNGTLKLYRDGSNGPMRTLVSRTTVSAFTRCPLFLRNGYQQTPTPIRKADMVLDSTTSGFLKGGPGQPAYLVRIKLAMAGDVEPNPGPSIQYPCGKCSKNTVNSWAAICHWCGVWFHQRCTDLTRQEVRSMKTPWRCPTCSLLAKPQEVYPCKVCKDHVGYFGWPANCSKCGAWAHRKCVKTHYSKEWNCADCCKPTVKFRKTVKILQWNAEGIRQKKEELVKFLAEQRVDIACIQESRLKDVTVFNIPGYTAIRKERGVSRRGDQTNVVGGGVLTLVKNDIAFTERPSPTVSQDQTTEWLWITVHLSKTQKLELHNIYVPPIRTSTTDQRIQCFDLTNLTLTPDTILLGDFNGHHPLWDDECVEVDTIGDKIAGWCAQTGCQILNEGDATHIHRGTGNKSSPDISLAHKRVARRAEWSVGVEMGSDHAPILISVAARRVRQPGRFTKSFKKANWPEFRRISENLFEEATAKNTPTAMERLLVDVIAKADKDSVPTGKVRDPKPWWNQNMAEAVKKRKEARARAHLGEEEKRAWNRACKEATEVRFKERREAWQNFANGLSYRTNPREVTKTINAMEGKYVGKSSATIKVNGKELSDDKEKAEAFMKEYASVSRLPQDKRDRQYKEALITGLRRECDGCQGMKTGICSPFTNGELNRALRKSPLGKAAGDDKIHNEHLLNLGPKGREFLLSLLNMSWKQGNVPHSWRRATIVPVPKPGKPAGKIGSYRPISLTSCVAKLAEKLVKGRLCWWLEQHQVLDSNQCGFRAMRLTTDQIARLQQVIQ